MRALLKGIMAVTVTGAVALSAACSRPAPKPASPPPSSLPAQSDYLSPPEPTAAARSPGGDLVLSGAARPDALIRLASPDGSAIGVAAAHDGTWTLTVPSGGQPRMYSLSEDASGRLLRAPGYITALPRPAPAAVMVRPGAGATPLAKSARPLSIATIDFDSGGAVVASGLATPRTTVRTRLDGADAGEDRADDHGVYTVALSSSVRPGPHTIEAFAGSNRAEAAFDVSPSHAIVRPPFAATPGQSGWRIDWMTPGGGVQTTLIFQSTEAAP